MSLLNKKIAVVGAGISGLSLCHRLCPKIEAKNLFLFDSSRNVGGMLKSRSINGFHFEKGPRSFIKETHNTDTQALFKDLGLCHRMIESQATKKIFFQNGTFTPASPDKFLWPILKRSVNHFCGGTSFYDKLPAKHFQNVSMRNFLADAELVSIFDILLSGVYAGDISRLSLESCVPSLTRAVLSSKRLFAAYVAKSLFGAFKTRNKNKIFSLVGGNEALCQAIYSDLLSKHVNIRLNFNLEMVEFLPNGRFNLAFAENKANAMFGPFDVVVFAISSDALSNIVKKSINADQSDSLNGKLMHLSRCLKHIPIAPIVTTNIAFDSHSVLPGDLCSSFGFLMPPSEAPPILGATFDSEAFPQHGSGPSETRLTFISGGYANTENVLLSNLYSDNAKIAKMAENALENQILEFIRRNMLEKGSAFPRTAALKTEKLFIPQPNVGHKTAVERIENGLREIGADGLFVAGWCYHGVSINKCIESSAALAEKICG